MQPSGSCGEVSTNLPQPFRELSELRRSLAEARETRLCEVDIDRYLNPPAATVHYLEYGFHLLGDLRGKTVLDVGCGSGQNLIPLLCRGATVIGIDLSPELITLAKERLARQGVQADLRVGSAYQTGLPNNSIDVVFCKGVAHHLDVAIFNAELRRVLACNGRIIFSEPIRFSQGYAALRALLPSRGLNSEYEHPLTRQEMSIFTSGFCLDQLRYFRLP
jgi:2-polyprenyl-3-methyl-5-hydroxy-6-metoxy-1,4-benzoquinol methylase